MKYTPAQMAQVVHELHRAMQYIHGDRCPAPPWDAAPEAMREAAVRGVERALRGVTPRQHHDEWMAEKLRAGWVHGPVKDYANLTHPWLLPYDEMPEHVRFLDRMFLANVALLADGGVDWRQPQMCG